MTAHTVFTACIGIFLVVLLLCRLTAGESSVGWPACVHAHCALADQEPCHAHRTPHVMQHALALAHNTGAPPRNPESLHQASILSIKLCCIVPYLCLHCPWPGQVSRLGPALRAREAALAAREQEVAALRAALAAARERVRLVARAGSCDVAAGVVVAQGPHMFMDEHCEHQRWSDRLHIPCQTLHQATCTHSTPWFVSHTVTGVTCAHHPILNRRRRRVRGGRARWGACGGRWRARWRRHAPTRTLRPGS